MFNIKNGVVPVSSKPSNLGNMDLTMRCFSAFNVPFPGKNGTMSLCFGGFLKQIQTCWCQTCFIIKQIEILEIWFDHLAFLFHVFIDVNNGKVIDD